MSLASLVPNLDTQTPDRTSTIPLLPQLGPLPSLAGAAAKPSIIPKLQPLAAPPALDASGMAGDTSMPSLPPVARPLVTNGSPRAAQEQLLQSRISTYEHPDPAQPGFWHRLGHIAAKVGNIAGDVFAPATMALIPGTDLNRAVGHAANIRELAGLQREDQQDQDDASRRNLEGAQAAHEAAETQQLENPNDWSVLPATTQGLFIRNTKTGELRPLSFNGQPLTPYEKPPQTEDSQLLGDQATSLQKGLQDRWQVLHPGQALPPQYALSPTMSVGGYKRLDGLLSGEESALGQRQNHEDAMANAAATRAVAEGNRDQKADAATKKAVYTAYQPSLDSAERFGVMAQNYIDAVKDHDQQAMLSLLANHLGMTMGLQKGARLTKDIIREAQESRPWLQGIQAKFDRDGVLSGVTLTPQQMRQMLDLGRDRFAEDITKSRSESKYLGSTDDGPDRVPNKATINFYLSLSGGDVAKAKDLARADGWTVQ